MSNNFQINSDQKLVLSEDISGKLIDFAIKQIITDASNYYYTQQKYSFIINDGNFPPIWNSYPDSRSNLVSILISSINHDFLFSKEFSKTTLAFLSDHLYTVDHLDSDNLRRKIIPAIYPNFDYKSEIIKLQENNATQEILINWISLASEKSNDEDLYNFLLSSIKRAPGSTELKVGILSKAFDKEVICEEVIKKIANSAPISLKRVVTQGLCNLSNRLRGKLTPWYKPPTEAEKLNINNKIDKAEALAMLFAATEDRQVIGSLSEGLSIKNLPWILPTASKFPWLVRNIQRRIDKGE